MKYLLPIKNIKLDKDLISIQFKNNNIDTIFLSCAFLYDVDKNQDKINLLFYNKFDYKKFLSRLKQVLNKNLIIYFVKFKIKGLGYRFKRITPNLYRFYFTRTSYIYFHRPANIIVKHRKKRIIMLSNNKQTLNNVLNSILSLHKVGPYNRRGFNYPRQIILKKPGKKVI